MPFDSGRGGSSIPMPQHRVYRGTSTAPHIGRLDPTGYITRGVRQSRKRSGIAATALKMMQNKTPVIRPRVVVKPKPIIRPKAVVHPPTSVAVPHPTNGTTSTLNTSSTGRITLAPPTTPANTDPNSSANVLPYDDGTALARDALSKSRDDALSNLTNLRNSLNENITSQNRNLDESQPGLALGLLNKYAGRGLAYSSGYGYGVGEQNRQIADQHAALSKQLQEGLANYGQQQQQAQDAYQQGLAQLNFQAAQNLAGKAGQLNIGPSAAPNSNLSLQQLATLLAGKKS